MDCGNAKRNTSQSLEVRLLKGGAITRSTEKQTGVIQGKQERRTFQVNVSQEVREQVWKLKNIPVMLERRREREEWC